MYTTEDLLALGEEIDNDPLGIYPTGGVDDTSNDVAISEAINEIRDTIRILKTALSTNSLFGVINDLEHQSLTAQQARYLDSVLLLGQINPFLDESVLTALRRMFSTNTSSRPSIENIILQNGNRLEQLYQNGIISNIGSFTPSTPSQIRAARA